MKLRILPLSVATAAAILVTAANLAPAYADPPPAPDFSGIDASTAGHLTGTINSPGSPEIYYRFSNAVGVQYRHLTLAGDSDTFNIPTWGYSGVTSVYAYTCLTEAQTAGECSTEAVVASFTPTDVVPTVTWSADTTIGPADQVTVTDVTDTGGGVLFAQFDNDVPGPDPARFSLVDGAVANIADGLGAMKAWRCDDLNPDQCAEFDPASPIYDIRQTLAVTADPVADIIGNHPNTSVQLHVNRSGTYDLDWHIAFPAGSDPGVSGSAPAGSPISPAGDLAEVIVPGAGLTADGEYRFVGTVTVHSDNGFGDYVTTLTASNGPTITVDRTGPTLTSVTASPTTIYPLVKNNTTYKSSTKFTVTGAGVPGITAVKLYKNSTGSFVRDLTLTPVDATHATVSWSGLLPDSSPAAAGLYRVKFFDVDGNVSPTSGSVTVSGKKLVLKTWTHVYTPAGTLADKYVGKCSTLRKPSLRGWAYSLGYYANTKCASQTSKDSLISTLHAVFLPNAVQYVDIHVTAYGGAATAKPGSKAIIRYLNTSGDWSNEKTISGTMGYHAGTTRTTTGLVFKDHSFGWGLYTGFGYKYDVKNFTVVLHYKVLG